MASDHPLTTGEAAEYCHVSQATIVNWIKDGKLNGYTTPGGHYRILRSDLLSFLETNGMPIDDALRESTRPTLLLLSDDPTMVDLVHTLGKSSNVEVSVATTDYETSAEAARSKPAIVIIDTRASRDPSGLCRWLSETSKATALVLIGDAAMSGSAPEADVHVPPEAARSLEGKLRALL
jgi:excisionase family DNA binding protein